MCARECVTVKLSVNVCVTETSERQECVSPPTGNEPILTKTTATTKNFSHFKYFSRGSKQASNKQTRLLFYLFKRLSVRSSAALFVDKENVKKYVDVVLKNEYFISATERKEGERQRKAV